MSDARKRGMEYAMTVGSITGSMFTREELAVAWCAGEERGRNDALNAVMEIINRLQLTYVDCEEEALPMDLRNRIERTIKEIQQLKKGGE